MQVSRPHRPRPDSLLLELPTPALHLVLQQLDQSSLACTAVTCSTLRKAVPAASSKVVVHCRHCPGTCTIDSYKFWLQQYGTSLASFQQCSVEGHIGVGLISLPCPQLRQLTLHNMVQLEPSDHGPGMLHACTGLVALDLECILVQGAPDAVAAIAAFSQLRSLRLVNMAVGGPESNSVFTDLQLPSQLTHLSLHCSCLKQEPELTAALSQLSTLLDLAHLQPTDLCGNGVPGGVPSQLVESTCLHISCQDDMGDAAAEQLRHLSSLTALRQLSVECDDMLPSNSVPCTADSP